MCVRRLLGRSLVVLAGLAAALPTRAGQPDVTLPLRVYTLPELARSLSTDGRTVLCPAAFAHRAALIRLDKRSWSAARRTLQTAFDVRFQPVVDRADTWRMELDPDRDALYDRWLMRLAELAVQEARENVADKQEAAALPYETIITQYIRADQIRSQLEEMDPDEEQEATRQASLNASQLAALADYGAYYGARLAQTLRPADVFRAMKSTQPFRRVDLPEPRSSPALRQFAAYMAAQLQREEAKADPEDREVYRTALATLEERFQAEWVGFSRLRFDPQSGSTQAQFIMQSDATADEEAGFYADPVQGNWLTILPRLGSTAEEWLNHDEETRRAVLKDPLAVRQVALQAGSGMTSLSEWLEEWAKQTGAEIVMELQPGRETIAATVDGSEVPVSMPVTMSAAQSTAGTLASMLSTPQPGALWSIRLDGGVWVLTDRLAFVDRLRMRPMAPLLALAADLRSGNGDRSTSALGAYARFHGSISAEQSAALGELATYRGVDLGTAATVRPAVQVLASLPREVRKRIAAALAAGKTVDIPISSVSTATITAVAASMREMALSSRGYAVPDFALAGTAAQSLRRMTLHLRPGDGGGTESFYAAFILANPTPQDTAVDYVECELPGSPEP